MTARPGSPRPATSSLPAPIYLAMFNPTLSRNKEERAEDNLLYFFPPETDTSLKLNHIGLMIGLAGLGLNFSNCPIREVTTGTHVTVLLNPVPNLWLMLSVDCSPQSVMQLIAESKGGQFASERGSSSMSAGSGRARKPSMMEDSFATQAASLRYLHGSIAQRGEGAASMAGFSDVNPASLRGMAQETGMTQSRARTYSSFVGDGTTSQASDDDAGGADGGEEEDDTAEHTKSTNYDDYTGRRCYYPTGRFKWVTPILRAYLVALWNALDLRFGVEMVHTVTYPALATKVLDEFVEKLALPFWRRMWGFSPFDAPSPEVDSPVGGMSGMGPSVLATFFPYLMLTAPVMLSEAIRLSSTLRLTDPALESSMVVCGGKLLFTTIPEGLYHTLWFLRWLLGPTMEGFVVTCRRLCNFPSGADAEPEGGGGAYDHLLRLRCTATDYASFTLLTLTPQRPSYAKVSTPLPTPPVSPEVISAGGAGGSSGLIYPTTYVATAASACSLTSSFAAAKGPTNSTRNSSTTNYPMEYRQTCGPRCVQDLDAFCQELLKLMQQNSVSAVVRNASIVAFFASIRGMNLRSSSNVPVNKRPIRQTPGKPLTDDAGVTAAVVLARMLCSYLLQEQRTCLACEDEVCLPPESPNRCRPKREKPHPRDAVYYAEEEGMIDWSRLQWWASTSTGPQSLGQPLPAATGGWIAPNDAEDFDTKGSKPSALEERWVQLFTDPKVWAVQRTQGGRLATFVFVGVPATPLSPTSDAASATTVPQFDFPHIQDLDSMSNALFSEMPFTT